MQRVDDLLRVVDRKRRLRHEGEICRIALRQPLDILDGFDQHDRTFRQLSDRADHFGVAGMPDQDDVAAASAVDLGFPVHLRDQRACRVDRQEIAALRFRWNRFGDAVGGENHRTGGVRDLRELLDENRALRLQRVHHVAIVHDLVAHIDGRAEAFERLLDDVDRTHNPGAESARRTKKNTKRRLFSHELFHVRGLLRAPPSLSSVARCQSKGGG